MGGGTASPLSVKPADSQGRGAAGSWAEGRGWRTKGSEGTGGK